MKLRDIIEDLKLKADQYDMGVCIRIYGNTGPIDHWVYHSKKDGSLKVPAFFKWNTYGNLDTEVFEQNEMNDTVDGKNYYLVKARSDYKPKKVESGQSWEKY